MQSVPQLPANGPKSERRLWGSENHQLTLGELVRGEVVETPQVEVPAHRRRRRDPIDGKSEDQALRFDPSVPVKEIQLANPEIDGKNLTDYEAIGEKLPNLRVLLPFATLDHVQVTLDKPHIRQAYDGFHKTAGLWARLNCDLAYVQSEIHPSASLEIGFPDNDANTEPSDWFAEAGLWGFAGQLAGEMTARTVPLAGIAEMADRVRFGNWESNLSGDLRPGI